MGAYFVDGRKFLMSLLLLIIVYLGAGKPLRPHGDFFYPMPTTVTAPKAIAAKKFQAHGSVTLPAPIYNFYHVKVQ